MRKLWLTLLGAVMALGPVSIAGAQTRVVTGRVYDAANQAGLAGAVVTMIGGTAAAQSDNEGRYRITLPTTEVTVIVRSVGYARTQARVAPDQTTLDVAMDREIIKLSEVVVSGAATTQERRNVSTAVSTVAGEELNRVPAASLDNALQGKVLGAYVNMNSGAPGGGGQVSIRGVTSILGNGEPLYVVDGVIISNAGVLDGHQLRHARQHCRDRDHDQPGQPDQSSRGRQPERHREHPGPEERRGVRHLRQQGDERRRHHPDEARQDGRSSFQPHAALRDVRRGPHRRLAPFHARDRAQCRCREGHRAGQLAVQSQLSVLRLPGTALRRERSRLRDRRSRERRLRQHAVFRVRDQQVRGRNPDQLQRQASVVADEPGPHLQPSLERQHFGVDLSAA